MRFAQSLHLAGQLAAASGQPTAGWLRWFVLGSVVLVFGLAWLCLRGYRNSSDEANDPKRAEKK